MSAVDRTGVALWALAAITGANALWMLLQPTTWFTDLPAAVPDEVAAAVLAAHPQRAGVVRAAVRVRAT